MATLSFQKVNPQRYEVEADGAPLGTLEWQQGTWGLWLILLEEHRYWAYIRYDSNLEVTKRRLWADYEESTHPDPLLGF